MKNEVDVSMINDEDINYDDIPEITDFSKGYKKPEIAERMKKGYTIIIEHEDHDEVIKVKRTIRARRPAKKVSV